MFAICLVLWIRFRDTPDHVPTIILLQVWRVRLSRKNYFEGEKRAPQKLSGNLNYRYGSFVRWHRQRQLSMAEFTSYITRLRCPRPYDRARWSPIDVGRAQILPGSSAYYYDNRRPWPNFRWFHTRRRRKRLWSGLGMARGILAKDHPKTHVTWL